ncbi:MAG TPA: cytochrome P460 family protein [Kofleriaceae bacterium]|nr:cytochrome P460 family protein [Kofleriaceae bacterium]
MRLYALLFMCACGSDPTPLIEKGYASSFTEVRNCRSSSDHDLHRIRVVADGASLDPYLTRATPFPLGATIVKEEYDFADTACAGDILEWTVMQRIDGDWRWQRLEPGNGADLRVKSDDDARCINCHATCGAPPDGYEGTCTVP